MTVSVVIPTYRRPNDLDRCLKGVVSQARQPDEIVVVCRTDDVETLAVTTRWINLVKVVHTHQPGQVAALKAGVSAAKSDILAFIDDDAVPRSDWLERLVSHFHNADVGAVGGRDVVHHPEGVLKGDADTVGVVTRYGRIIGNHHLGHGAVRPVDIAKGANCAYRRASYGSPSGLRGSGAEVGNDLASSLWVRARGEIVLYDPAAIVDHYVGVRHDEDKRGSPTRRAELDATYNVSLAVLYLRPELRWRYLSYQFVVGSRPSPGIVRTIYGCLQWDPGPLRRLLTTQRTIWQAARAAADGDMVFWTVCDVLGSDMSRPTQLMPSGKGIRNLFRWYLRPTAERR
jgi:glycosyltransferase involved in cell wall biosynthesis